MTARRSTKSPGRKAKSAREQAAKKRMPRKKGGKGKAAKEKAGARARKSAKKKASSPEPGAAVGRKRAASTSKRRASARSASAKKAEGTNRAAKKKKATRRRRDAEAGAAAAPLSGGTPTRQAGRRRPPRPTAPTGERLIPPPPAHVPTQGDVREAALASLAIAPDPEAARRLADRLLATLPDPPQPGSAAFEALCRVLHAICGVAPFFARLFERHPDWLPRLLDEDLSSPLEAEALRARLEARLPSPLPEAETLGAMLQRFKYYELARITVRDCSDELVPLERSEETLLEVSNLADVILAAALEGAIGEFEARHGPARWRTSDGREVSLAFCVLGLGKLGSQELNYSSDVDLVYIYSAPPGPLFAPEDGGSRFARRDPADYFSRLAQLYGRILQNKSGEGFLYRVDLDLRPDGAQGALAVSTETLGTYYEAWADTWERAAFMKARPVAGDLPMGWRTIRNLGPMIYYSSMDFGGVEGIRSLKKKVEERRGGQERGWNIKIDAGGIRDIEFLAQALQLLHGGLISQVRERGTRRALKRIGEVGLLSQTETERLIDAYRFLRRVENRLQMEGERQTHTVPADDSACLRLARAVGFHGDDALARFRAALDSQREIVLDLHDEGVAESGRDRILELFTRSVPQLLELKSTRGMLEGLADAFAREIDASGDSERALNNLDRFIKGLGGRRFYYELLLDRPELVPRLVGLFSRSNYFSGYLARQPRLIEPVFADPTVLLPDRASLEADLEATIAASEAAQGGDEAWLEAGLDGLRIFQHRQLINVGLLDIAGQIERREVEGALTDIAEVCLARGLALAERQCAGSRKGIPDAARRGRFLVVGMGKLGSRELSYGSDLDVIFLYALDEADRSQAPEAQAHYVRLTQRLITGLQTATREGACYEIDARLRPSGNQGTLVTSIEAFERYHEGPAELWERQTLLRARPVAGDPALAERFETLRRRIVQRPLTQDATAELHRIRRRMEQELANETGMRRNFKTGRGGLLDIESVVQRLQLGGARAHPELVEVIRTEEQLDRLHALGLLDAEAHDVLVRGWEFLQRLARSLRIVENRSISDLDSERGDLDGLALHLGYPPTEGREGGARRGLLRDYKEHTEAVRRIYERTLGVDSP